METDAAQTWLPLVREVSLRYITKGHPQARRPATWGCLAGESTAWPWGLTGRFHSAVMTCDAAQPHFAALAVLGGLTGIRYVGL